MIRGITVLNTALSIGLFLMFSIALFLFVRRKSGNPANIYLGGLLFIFWSMLLPGWVWGARLLEQFHFVVLLSWLVSFAMGPLLYFYAKASTERNFKFRRRDLWHFAPMFVSWCYVLPLALLDGSELVASFEETLRSGSRIILPDWEQLLRLLQMLVYFVVSIMIALRYRRHILATSSNVEQSYHRWLLGLSLVLLIPILGIVLFTVGLSGHETISRTTFAYSLIIFAVAVYIAILFKPSLFNHFPNRMASTQVAAAERDKYQTSALDDARKDRLVERLLAHVTAERPYLETQLTLGELADQLDLPAHYLSQIINERLECSFLDFINRYRVESAQQMMTEAQYEHYSLVGIGYEAGFNSKTAFYTAFKRVTGTTPGAYRKSLTVV